MGARPIHCAFALASLMLVPSARAESAALGSPPGCGTRDSFEAEVRARLGPRPSLDDVSFEISPRPAGFQLRVRVGTEQRQLEDPSCAELFRAAVVIAVSMLLQGQSAYSTADSPKASAPSPAPPPAPPSRPTWGLALGAGLSAGTLPKPVLALELEGKARWGQLGVGAHVQYLLPAERLDATEQGAELSALGVGVAGMVLPSPTWEARLGLAAQRLMGRGVGTSTDYSDAVWAAGPTLGLAWAPLRLGRAWAGVGAAGQLNLARGRFEIRNYSGELTGENHVVYRVPSLAANAFVRFGWVW